MATISSNGSLNHHKFTLNVVENIESYSINYSFILSPIQSGWNWSGWSSKISYSINIGNKIFSGTIPSYDGSSTITLSSGNINLKDINNDTITISFSVSDSTGQSYTCGSASAISILNLVSIGILRILINNVWKRATAYIGVGGIWKKCKAYIGKNGEWKRGK